ncbi:hypothetical protein, partial [Shewanella algae]|uniref:hypothetical protein n=1 Tax=Shewanella algae TaxID=38313 RepID=UPI00313E22CE
DALVARLGTVESAGGGRRILVIESGAAAGAIALAVGRALARTGRAVLVRMDGPVAENGDGLSDVVAGEASFGTAIRGDEGSWLH